VSSDFGTSRRVKVCFPKQVAPYIDPTTRTVDVASVYASATPRHVITYGQSSGGPAAYRRVVSERIGDGALVGGTFQFDYQRAASWPSSQRTPRPRRPSRGPIGAERLSIKQTTARLTMAPAGCNLLPCFTILHVQVDWFGGLSPT
jgi:hypothetical protein